MKKIIYIAIAIIITSGIDIALKNYFNLDSKSMTIGHITGILYGAVLVLIINNKD